MITTFQLYSKNENFLKIRFFDVLQSLISKYNLNAYCCTLRIKRYYK